MRFFKKPTNDRVSPLSFSNPPQPFGTGSLEGVFAVFFLFFIGAPPNLFFIDTLPRHRNAGRSLGICSAVIMGYFLHPAPPPCGTTPATKQRPHVSPSQPRCVHPLFVVVKFLTHAATKRFFFFFLLTLSKSLWRTLGDMIRLECSASFSFPQLKSTRPPRKQVFCADQDLSFPSPWRLHRE